MLELDDAKETVKEIVSRLRSPVSFYNIDFVESDTVLEISVETSQDSLPQVLFILEEGLFRVLKARNLDPNGYSSYEYRGPFRLVSLLVTQLAPVFHKGCIELLSLVFKENIRTWKDLIRVVCTQCGVKYTDFGESMSVLGVSIEYNLDTHLLSFKGGYEESLSCFRSDVLLYAILDVLDYLWELEKVEANPFLEVEFLNDEDMGDTLEGAADSAMAGGFEGELGDIDAGGDMGDMGGEGDLADTFEPMDAGDDSPAPDLDAGKEALMEGVQ